MNTTRYNLPISFLEKEMNAPSKPHAAVSSTARSIESSIDSESLNPAQILQSLRFPGLKIPVLNLENIAVVLVVLVQVGTHVALLLLLRLLRVRHFIRLIAVLHFAAIRLPAA